MLETFLLKCVLTNHEAHFHFVSLCLQDNQSEISHTESHASHRPSHTRSGSRVSGQSSLSKLRRGSSSSLPTSLLNLGEVSFLEIYTIHAFESMKFLFKLFSFICWYQIINSALLNSLLRIHEYLLSADLWWILYALPVPCIITSLHQHAL